MKWRGGGDSRILAGSLSFQGEGSGDQSWPTESKGETI